MTPVLSEFLHELDSSFELYMHIWNREILKQQLATMFVIELLSVQKLLLHVMLWICIIGVYAYVQIVVSNRNHIK